MQAHTAFREGKGENFLLDIPFHRDECNDDVMTTSAETKRLAHRLSLAYRSGLVARGSRQRRTTSGIRFSRGLAVPIQGTIPKTRYVLSANNKSSSLTAIPARFL